MAKISTYPQPTPPQLGDYVIGTDISDLLMTKNYLLSDIITLATTTNQFVTIVGAQTITGSKTFDYGTTTGVNAPVIINLPAQTQSISPDGLQIYINGQVPTSTPGFIAGVNVQANFLDNICYFGTLYGNAGASTGIVIESLDAHSGNFLEFKKGVSSVFTTKFSVANNGDTTANSFIKDGGTNVQFLMADGSISTSPILGTGTTNFLPKFTGATTLGDSLIFSDNNQVLIGTTTTGTPTFGIAPKIVVADIAGGVIELRSLDTNIAPGSLFGRLQFSGKDDTTVAYATAAIEAVSQTFAGTGNGGGGILKFMTAPQLTGGSPTERMRINQEGKVGVGTTVPTSQLHSVASLFGPISYDARCAVFGYNTSTETLYNNPVGIAGRVLTSGGFAVYGDAQTGGGWAGYFDGKGYFKDNLGIGTIGTPTSKLQVVGLVSYADNAAALAGGLTLGAFYHTAGVVKVVI
jgi:hypothetical protein